jgi:mono/diheme cytochrome c family protein
MKRRKLFVICASTLGVVGLGLVGLAVFASHEATRMRDVPYPTVVAARSAAGIARGATIFQGTCEACHRPAGGERASGARMAEVPEWLGQFYAQNLTSDPRAGIGSLSDGAVARMIRFGVNHDGRWGPMPSYGMSDADLAAVIGYMRSEDPLFAPDPKPVPPSELSLLGQVALVLAGQLTPPDRPAAGVEAPARAPSAEYGRYLAGEVYQCGDCHTAGMEPDKVRGPDAYAGGADMVGANGETMYSPNLTPDVRTGIGRWDRGDFARAVREGSRPDGAVLRSPMPRFRGLDDVEVDALFTFLRSLPARSNPSPVELPEAALFAVEGRSRDLPVRQLPVHGLTSGEQLLCSRARTRVEVMRGGGARSARSPGRLKRAPPPVSRSKRAFGRASEKTRQHGEATRGRPGVRDRIDPGKW